MGPLITVDELAQHMATTFADEPTRQAATAVIDEVTASISVHCRRDVTGLPNDIPSYVLTAAKLVAKRVAARIMRNPDMRQSFKGPEGLDYSMIANLPEMILTGQEERNLAPLVDVAGIYG